MTDKKKIYYRIDCTEAKRLGLSGTMKDVYFFIKSFKEGVTMGLDNMAEYLCMPKTTMRRALYTLEKWGYITSEKSGYVFNGGERMRYTYVQIGTRVQNGHRGMSNMDTGEYQNGHRGMSNMDTGLNIIGDTVKEYSKRYSKSYTAEKAPESNGDEVLVMRSALLEIFVKFYEKKIGRPYLPKYATQTTVCAELVEKVVTLMKYAGREVGKEAFAETWGEILTRGWDATDQFTHDRWTLDFINSQFNVILNQVNTQRNGKASNSNAASDPEGFMRAFAERYGTR